MSLAEVKPFPYGQPLTDVPKMLRDLADKIEAGDYGEVREVVVLRDQLAECGRHDPAIHAYGRCTPESSLKMISCAQHMLVKLFCTCEPSR